MITDEQVIQYTKNWVEKVVIGCNFCPFAAREVTRGGAHYAIVRTDDIEQSLLSVIQECERLDTTEEIGTTLLIFPDHFGKFDAFLDLLSFSEALLEEHDYEGIYQIASFHPHYRFADVQANDPSNYTNRSPYPMLHLLRESSIDKALENYPDPEGIPDRNIAYAKAQGLAQMKALLSACMVKD